ncbi:hypothetical protein F5X96DRAFT_638523 [Biscogniauxia mediterranea]|nr:hypothetical protein F5X96DRAFT_638523 [Biscogniauxia mediterranea]
MYISLTYPMLSNVVLSLGLPSEAYVAVIVACYPVLTRFIIGIVSFISCLLPTVHTSLFM